MYFSICSKSHAKTESGSRTTEIPQRTTQSGSREFLEIQKFEIQLLNIGPAPEIFSSYISKFQSVASRYRFRKLLA